MLSILDGYLLPQFRTKDGGRSCCPAVRTSRALQPISPFIYPPYVTAPTVLYFVLAECDPFCSRPGRRITFQKHTTVCNLRESCMLLHTTCTSKTILCQCLPQTLNPQSPPKAVESVSLSFGGFRAGTLSGIALEL